MTDSQNSTKSGRSLETLGSYDARHGDKAVFKDERVKYWLSKGAQASGTVHNLLVSKKVIDGKKINVLPLKKAIVKEVEAVAPTPASSAPAVETPVVDEPTSTSEAQATIA